MTSKLEKELSTLENQCSYFEQALRQELPESLAVFKESDSVAFDVDQPLDSIIPESLSTLAESNYANVLSAVPSDASINSKRVAVLFSGGPAAGGHNVLLGLAKYLGQKNQLFGVRRGPKGLINGDLFEISLDLLQSVQNGGGFNFLMSDRTKIKTEEQFLSVEAVVKKFKLDAIVIIGGDDSNTNAAVLAQRLLNLNCSVVGVPKTIDGDLQVGSHLPITFGFDTATKIYSEMVGNILQDTASSVKYWHFVKLMGRSASHVTLEVGLQTRPAVTLVSEEVAKKQYSLQDIVSKIASVVVKRFESGICHGVVLVPEGIIEFIPEFNELIQALNDWLPTCTDQFSSYEECLPLLRNALSPALYTLFTSIPSDIGIMLLSDRDAHGNLQVSLIQTEQLLARMVMHHIEENHSSVPFNYLTHFFGYEGRCGAPTRFDAFYTYNLGQVAGALALNAKTGYLAAITDFDKGGRALGIPLASLVVSERREGVETLVIEKALVTLDSPAFRYFESRRSDWEKTDCFMSPGPRQYWGAFSNQLPMTVALNQSYDSLVLSV